VAEPISDRQVVAVLRPFVRATGPVLDALRESDPLGLRARALAGDTETDRGLLDKLRDALSDVHVPGTPAWGAMDVDQRVSWWIGRVGRLTSLLASVPGLGGALADRLPVQTTLGAAGQGLLLCAIAGEHGITDTGDRVRLLAAIMFDRRVDPALASGAPTPEEERVTAELTEDLSTSERKHGRLTVRAVGGTLWKLGRTLWGIQDELDKRPHGRFYHQALGMLPVVGMLGDYLGERSGLKRAAKAARKWITAEQAVRR
jgi:hypothetical protein